ncbi:MAG: M42 family metallopeptidase [Chloroflexi bacterium]|nr:M42 family metallopeptidase [Chloroflexota bacterium]MCI0579332.1 M42 family metallopeptidase [Chloroflexota bacterium]MCI0644975.1 M42 family metallopeptidase [Chloroflexota bacterium]MCI0727854.1 M42 family metallopeptidase [Chloroflexota bacterium]
MKELIKKLVEAYGPSGFEDHMRQLIRPEIEPLADELSVDAMGNLIALKKGDGRGLKVMVAAHMDEIGLMVSHITKEGFLRFTNIGGVFPHTLMGGRVQFANGTIGVVYSERLPDWSKIHPLDKHYIDVGASSPEDCPVEVGDAAGFVQQLLVQGSRYTAKSMDDRIGCVVAIEAFKQLASTPHDVYFVFSVQEEVGTRGAQVAANRINPDVGIAVDITPAGDVPESQFMPIALGKGPAIKVKDTGMIAHAGLVRLMKQRASEATIPYQLEVLERGSTDARAMQLANAGNVAGCISIPCRFAHSPSETVDNGDVEGAIKLLVELLSQPIEL